MTEMRQASPVEKPLAERIEGEKRPETLPDVLAKFEAYWWQISDAELGMPYRRDFDMAAIAPLLSHIAILDLEHDEDGATRYRYRFAGTWHLENFGVELTGRYIDDLRRGNSLDTIHGALVGIAQSRSLHYWRRRSMIEGREYMVYSRLMGPLADDDGTVVQLVGCFVRS